MNLVLRIIIIILIIIIIINPHGTISQLMSFFINSEVSIVILLILLTFKPIVLQAELHTLNYYPILMNLPLVFNLIQTN
jgi:hypothetical protein